MIKIGLKTFQSLANKWKIYIIIKERREMCCKGGETTVEKMRSPGFRFRNIDLNNQ